MSDKLKLVILGGGKGQSALLQGLKSIPNLELNAIVTVADDGGSTGRLRDDFEMPGMGDVRNVLVSLAEHESKISKIMDYRFDESLRSELAGHSLGNLILAALTDTTGSFMDAITFLSEVLNVEGRIIPASEDFITLCARMKDGTIVRGESNIPTYKNYIDEVFYDTHVNANPDAVKAILEADLILFGVGSIYTSILPNVIIPDIHNALKQSKGKKVYYCNAMTQSGETTGFTAEDHVDALLKHAQTNLDLVVANGTKIPKHVLDTYRHEESEEVLFDSLEQEYQILHQDLLSFDKNRIRHSPIKVKNGFHEVLEVLGLCHLVVK